MRIDKILMIPIPYRFLLIDSIPYRFDSLSILLLTLILTFNLILLYYIVFIIIQYKYLHALTTDVGFCEAVNELFHTSSEANR